MSDAPSPDSSQAETPEHPVMATIRRAPRFARMVMTGVGGGFVLGALIGLGLPGRGTELRGVTVILVGLAFALIGGLVSGGVATRYDARSVRPVNPRARHAATGPTETGTE